MPPHVENYGNMLHQTMKNRKLLAALLAYLGVVYSKRFWLGSLDGMPFWLADATCFVVIPAILIAWVVRQGSPFKEFERPVLYGPARMNAGTVAFYSLTCLTILLLVTPIAAGLATAIRRANPDLLIQTLNYGSKLPKDGSFKVFAALYFGLTAGIVEEFFFRGVLKTVMGAYVTQSKLAFVLISTLIFGSAHWAAGLGAVISTGCWGFAFAMLYLWTKDLRPLMISHCLFDFFYYAR